MIAFFLGPIGRYLLIFAVVAAALGGLYAKGRVDGKAAYQAKLEREIKAAIDKGDTARSDALKKFDSNKEIEDDGFTRPD
jgi:hypothetical protein